MSVIRLLLCILLAIETLLPAAEPSVGFNNWTNIPGVVEGVVTTRPIDTTLPRPPLGYVEYLPRGYNPQDGVTKWPLLIYMAGIGEIGNGTDTAANNYQLSRLMIVHGPLFQVTKRQWDFPCIVLAPQSPTYWNTASIMKTVITYAKAQYRVDDSRIYLTGLCEGGSGVVNFAGLNPGILAGILPIEVSSGPSVTMAQNIKNLPMWAGHCFADPSIARTASIAWVDQAAIADSGASNTMATYPGYAGKNYHYAVDADPTTGKPLNASGPTQRIDNCTVTFGDKKISWTSPTFGSAMFNSWGGTDAQPYAQVRINVGPTPDPWVKAGVMFRDSTAPGSRMVMVAQGPNNEVFMQWRTATGGGAGGGSRIGGTDAVKWVKLTKTGSSFTGSYSLDGSTWTPIGTQAFTSVSDAYLGGLAVTAHNNSTTYTQAFTNVSIAGISPTSLTDIDIGSPAVAGSATFADSTWKVTGGGDDIWGNADQFNYAYTSVSGDQTIIAKVGTNTAVATNVIDVGKNNHLLLTRPYSGPSGTASITIQTPVGYNNTAYFNPATSQWTWVRGQSWDRTKPSKRLFTMFWYQDHVNGWVETWANGDCWDWLFSQVKATAPVITAQPQSTTVADGSSATFTVVASGTEPTFAWKRNGTPISGATAAGYTLPSAGLGDSGAAFTVVVSNAAGSVTSLGATLTVTAVAPAIVTQPQGQTVDEGQVATFSVTASGSAPLTYQWSRNGTFITGATSAIYTTGATTSADSGAAFAAVVTNSGGSVTSASATLTVARQPPAIIDQPDALTVADGQSAIYTVAASGNGLTCQWSRNGAPIAGATGFSYTISSATLGDSGATFAAVVSNSVGSVTSASAALTVTAVAPAIVEHPTNREVAVGGQATFAVVANGSAPLAYQWLRNGTAIVNATNATYTTTPVSTTDQGATFAVTVSNAAGTVQSMSAILNILGLHADTIAWQSRASSAGDVSGYISPVDDLLRGIDAGGFRSKIKRLNLFAGDSSPAALIPQIVTWGATADRLGLTPAYSGGEGFAFASGSHIKTGFVPSTQAGFSSLDASWGAWATVGTTPDANRYLLGAVTNSGINRFGMRWSTNGNGCFGYLGSTNDVAHGVTGFTNGLLSGLWSASNLAGTRSDFYRNGVSMSSDTSFAIDGKPSVEVYIGSSNNTVEHGNATVGGYWFGTGLAQTEMETMYRLMTRYASSVGRQRNTAFWGDSMTGLGSSDWVATYMATREPRRTSYNGGVGGQLAAAIQARFDADIASPTTRRQWNQVFWAGRNDIRAGFSPADTKARIDAMVATLGHTRYRVIEVLPRNVASEFTGSSLRQLLDHLNSLLESTYGARFVRILPSLQAMSTGSAQDATDVANGVVPTSLSADGVHLTLGSISGNSIVADRLWASTMGGWASATMASPSIVSHPVAQSVSEGQSATFTLAANGTAPLTYQWLRNGSAISGATSSTYTTSATALVDSGATFAASVSNPVGSATSNSATLTVNAVAPAIVSQPQGATATVGQPATFTVAASGSAPLAYQWMRDGVDVSGATSASYAITATSAADNSAVFAVRVSNPAGTVTSASATLAVISGTVTVAEPGDHRVIQRAIGTSAGQVSFTGSYTGTPHHLQARVVAFAGGVAVVDWTTVVAAPSGGTYSASLSVPQGGWYRLEVRGRDEANNVLAQDSTESKWGIGVNVLCIGQSNMVGLGNNEFTIADDRVGLLYGGTTWKHLADPWISGGKASCGPAMGNSLVAELGVPVGLIPSAAGTNYIVGNGTNSLSRRTAGNPTDSTTVYGQALGAALVAGGVEFVVVSQGANEAVAGTVTAASYVASFTQMKDNFKQDLPNGLAVTFALSQLGRRINVGDYDAGYNIIREAHRQLDDGASVMLAGTTMDFTIVDSTSHYGGSGQNAHGRRFARALLHRLGLRSTSGGPRISQARFLDDTQTTVRITIAHRGGSDFTPATGISGFAISDSTGPKVVTAIRIDGSTIDVTSTTAFVVDARLTYLAGKNPAGPSGLFFDNQADPEPLQPVTVPMAIAVALPTAPSISVAPQNAAVFVGQSASFAVTAHGTGPLQYQWKANGVAIDGAIARTYSTPPAALVENGREFTVTVTNTVGLVTSNSAVLTVNAAASTEPALAINGWSNAPGVVEGTIRVRPVNTTLPRPPYGYLDYLPLGYNASDIVTVWPVIIYLPSVTEAGDGTDTDANVHQLYQQLVKYGPLRQVVTDRWDFPAIVVVPQVTTNWSKPLNVKNVVEYVKQNYRVDVNRIYMTGNLEGASGTFRFVGTYPSDLAGILTIEANTASTITTATAVKGLPMWASHSFANPTVARTLSIGWIDATTVADLGSASDVMGTYPGYGDRNHFAVDTDPATGKPLDPNGSAIEITGATVTAGSKTITFPSGTFYGSTIFNMWSGTDTTPFARVSIEGESTPFTSARGYSTSLNLTTTFTGTTGARNITIRTPVGYNATAQQDAGAGSWRWSRGQAWNESREDKRILTLFWYQNPTDGWTQTWGNVQTWNWLLSQVKAPAAGG